MWRMSEWWLMVQGNRACHTPAPFYVGNGTTGIEQVSAFPSSASRTRTTADSQVKWLADDVLRRKGEMGIGTMGERRGGNWRVGDGDQGSDSCVRCRRRDRQWNSMTLAMRRWSGTAQMTAGTVVEVSECREQREEKGARLCSEWGARLRRCPASGLSVPPPDRCASNPRSQSRSFQPPDPLSPLPITHSGSPAVG